MLLESLSPIIDEILSFISRAALFVNVNAKISKGSIPLLTRCTILYVKTLVLPDPAPAITMEGPSVFNTAFN